MLGSYSVPTGVLSSWELMPTRLPLAHAWPTAGIIQKLFPPTPGGRLQPVPQPSPSRLGPPVTHTHSYKEHPGLASATGMPIPQALPPLSLPKDAPVSYTPEPLPPSQPHPKFGPRGSLLDKDTHRGKPLSPPTTPKFPDTHCPDLQRPTVKAWGCPGSCLPPTPLHLQR